jgi:hypothetical protein
LAALVDPARPAACGSVHAGLGREINDVATPAAPMLERFLEILLCPLSLSLLMGLA